MVALERLDVGCARGDPRTSLRDSLLYIPGFILFVPIISESLSVSQHTPRGNMKPRVSSFAALRMRKPLRAHGECDPRSPFPDFPACKSAISSFPSARFTRCTLSPLLRKPRLRITRSTVKIETLKNGLKTKSAAQSPRKLEITQEIGHSHRREVVKSDLKAQFYTSSRRRDTSRGKPSGRQSPKELWLAPTCRDCEEFLPPPSFAFPSGKGFYRTLPIGHNSIYYQEENASPVRCNEKFNVHVTARRLL